MNTKQDMKSEPVKVFQSGDCCVEVFINNTIENGHMVRYAAVSFAKRSPQGRFTKGTGILRQTDLPAAIVTLGAAHDWIRRLTPGGRQGI